MNIRPSTGESRSVRPDIQGLRALAVLYVVFYHARLPYFTGGFVGVDVFFVISGYLITGLLVRELERKGRIDFAAFYARRIRRLLPAAVVVLVVTAVFVRILLSPLEQREMVPAILSSALYFSNLWFATQATDYLAGGLHSNPLLHTWSLSVEEQFYLVWPALMVLGARAGSAARSRARLTMMLWAILLASLVAAIVTTEVSQPWAFFGSPTRAWEFAVGGLAYMGHGRFADLSRVAKDVLALVGLAGTIAAVLLFDKHTRFPGFAALVPVAGALLVVLGGAGAPGRIARCFDLPIIQTIGNLSYSWYLWHWPVFVFAMVIAAPLATGMRVACMLLSFVLAWITYAIIENPVRFSSVLTAAPLRSIALGVCLTVVSGGSALALRAATKSDLGAPGQAEYAQARDDLPKVYRDGCHASFSVVQPAECVYGDTVGAKTMVLFGDSHAAQWFPALERIAEAQRWRLVSLTKSACPSALVTVQNQSLGREYKECALWRSHVLERIARERPTLVVLANSSKYLTDPLQGIDASAWQQGMHQTLVELQRTGASVVVLRDTPWPGFDVPICLSRAAWQGKSLSLCNFDRNDAVDSVVYELDRKAAVKVEKAAVLDISDLVCVGPQCQSLIGGRIAYRDDHHLTAWVSARLASAMSDLFGRQLRQAATSAWREWRGTDESENSLSPTAKPPLAAMAKR